MSFGVIASQARGGSGNTGNSTYAATVLQDNPLLFMQFDETSGTVATDHSGFNRNGVYQNTPYLGQYSIVPKSPGRSVRFENGTGGAGVSQQVTVPYGSWMDTAECTICFAAFLEVAGLNIFASRYNEPGDDWSWFVYSQSGTLRFFYRSTTGVGTSIDTGYTPVQGQRYYVAAYVKASGCGIRLYSTSGLVASATGAGGAVNPSSRAITFMNAESGSYKATGYLDEMAVFGSALSTARLDTYANLALAPETVPWINRVAGTSARNGTTNQTISFTPAAAGSLLVAIVNAPAVHTALTPGWTKRVAATGDSELAVFTRSANAGDASLQLQQSVSNFPMNYVLYEFPSGSSWYTSAFENASGTYPDLTSLPGTPLTIFAANGVSRSAYENTTGDQTWKYFWIRDFNQSVLNDGTSDGVYTSVAYFNDFIDATASVYTPAQQFTGGPTRQVLLFALVIP